MSLTRDTGLRDTGQYPSPASRVSQSRVSIIFQLTRQDTWEAFLAYRLMKGRFSWHEFDEADAFVEREDYLPLATKLAQGESLGIPTKKLVNKMGSGKKRVVYSFAPDEMLILKRPYVNKAQLRVDVENQYTGSGSSKLRNDWLQPAEHMLLIKEESMERFFRNRELPTDSCALLSDLTEGVDSLGNTVYYYTYDMSDFLTSQLRQWEKKEDLTVPELQMVLVPVSVETSSTVYSSSTVSAVRQQQTVSATKIRSAKNGMDLKIVYSGF